MNISLQNLFYEIQYIFCINQKKLMESTVDNVSINKHFSLSLTMAMAGVKKSQQYLIKMLGRYPIIASKSS